MNSPSKFNIKELKDKGYTDIEISTALAWIQTQKTKKDFIKPYLSRKIDSEPFRVFSKDEMSFFTSDAIFTINSLLSIGILNPIHLDLFIEGASKTGYKKINNEMLCKFINHNLDIYSPWSNNSRPSFSDNNYIN